MKGIACNRLKIGMGLALLSLAYLSFGIPSIYANNVQIKGTSSAMITGKCGRGDTVRGKKDKQILSDTLHEAKSNAIRRHVANSGTVPEDHGVVRRVSPAAYSCQC